MCCSRCLDLCRALCRKKSGCEPNPAKLQLLVVSGGGYGACSSVAYCIECCPQESPAVAKTLCNIAICAIQNLCLGIFCQSTEFIWLFFVLGGLCKVNLCCFVFLFIYFPVCLFTQDMGFSENNARTALECTDNSVARAADMILCGNLPVVEIVL